MGRLSRLLHPTEGRFEPPPPNVVPLGRSVITPANRSLANIVLSPSAVVRIRRALARERFDLIHVHEPLTPAVSVAALGQESFGMVLTRAFAAATPVVASDIDGYRQLVGDPCGALVPPGDAKRFADAIVSLLRDESLRRRYAAAAHELVVDSYGWPLIAARLRVLYNALLDTGGSRAA